MGLKSLGTEVPRFRRTAIDRTSALQGLPGDPLEKGFGTVGLHQVDTPPPSCSGDPSCPWVDPFGLLKAARYKPSDSPARTRWLRQGLPRRRAKAIGSSGAVTLARQWRVHKFFNGDSIGRSSGDSGVPARL